eukprot:93266_1
MFHIMRSHRNGNIDQQSNKYVYWYSERKPLTITDIMYKATKSKAQQYQLTNMNLMKKIRKLYKEISKLSESLENKSHEYSEKELYVEELQEKIQEIATINEQTMKQLKQSHERRHQGTKRTYEQSLRELKMSHQQDISETYTL